MQSYLISDVKKEADAVADVPPTAVVAPLIAIVITSLNGDDGCDYGVCDVFDGCYSCKRIAHVFQ